MVIHCAGISTVADAQQDPALARKVNIEATRFLAELAAEVQFVFFSTDWCSTAARGSTGKPTFQTLYTLRRIQGRRGTNSPEKSTASYCRTSINGGISAAGNRGFNEQLRHALETGRGMKLFTDEFRCPIFAGETARAVVGIGRKRVARELST